MLRKVRRVLERASSAMRLCLFLVLEKGAVGV